MSSIRDLAVELRVNPNTVQRAYRELEQGGVLFTRRGQGSFVSEDLDLVARLRQQIATAAARRYWAEVRALGISLDKARKLVEKAVDDDQATDKTNHKRGDRVR
jgi:GntR family transcriptional regulator